MFTGIIESIGKVRSLKNNETNLELSVECAFLKELKVDQSIAHNGVCLTVTDIFEDYYKVTIIKESLDKSNLNSLNIGDQINLERCLKVGDRLDGHWVQGHVDTTGKCVNIEEIEGSTKFTFEHGNYKYRTIPKGSITVNGVSLTVVDSSETQFSVWIIPFTIEHTNFKNIKIGESVNLEFDILGKYIQLSR